MAALGWAIAAKKAERSVPLRDTPNPVTEPPQQKRIKQQP
jgi:hypothetical protein